MGTTKATKKSTKRERTKYTPEQLDILESIFANTQYPDSITMEELADKLDISNEKVSIWFQNRRSKFKKQSRESQVYWMRKQVFNQENTPSLLNMPCATETKQQMISPPEGAHKRHVLSAISMNKVSSPDNTRPSSNLHYKPTTSALTTMPISWEPNFRYTTPSPPFDISSCASDILRDSNVNPTTARPDYPTDIQFYGQPSPPRVYWSSCMSNPTRTLPVLSPTSTTLPVLSPTSTLPHYPFSTPVDLTNQQFTVL